MKLAIFIAFLLAGSALTQTVSSVETCAAAIKTDLVLVNKLAKTLTSSGILAALDLLGDSAQTFGKSDDACKNVDPKAMVETAFKNMDVEEKECVNRVIDMIFKVKHSAEKLDGSDTNEQWKKRTDKLEIIGKLLFVNSLKCFSSLTAKLLA